MTTNYTIGVRFTGNSGSLDAASAKATSDLTGVGRAGQQAGAAAVRGLQPVDRQLDSITRRAMQAGAALVGAAALTQVGKGLARFADEYSNIGAQMRLATDNSVSFGKAQDSNYAIAQRTASSLASTADLTSKVTRSLKGMGEEGAAAFVRASHLTETIQQAVALSNVSAEAGNAALTQLTQGLSSGVLRGDELNSVLEQTPRLAQAIADGMGVTVGQLRALGAQGMITSQQVITALEGQAEALRGEYANLPLTIDRSWTVLVNSVERYVGMADQASGVSKLIAQGIAGIADHIDDVVTGIAVIGATAALNLGTKGLQAVASFTAGIVESAKAQLQAVKSEQAAAAAAVDSARAKSVETAATLEAVQAARAEETAKLAVAQADIVMAQRHLDAAKSAGILSFAVREQGIALNELTAAKARQAAAVNELAALGRAEAGVQSALTAASTAQIAAQTRAAAATTYTSLAMSGLQKVGSSLLALLGGWPGVVLAAAAAVVYLATQQSEAEKIASKLTETSVQLASAHGRVTEAAIHEAEAQMLAAQAALAAKEAHLKSLEAGRSAVTGAQNFDTMGVAAADASREVEKLRISLDKSDEALRAAKVALSFQENADQLSRMAKAETEGFDALRASLKDQNAELEKQIATYGKGKAAQLEYAESIEIAAERAKGDTNITRARIGALQDLYAPLIENAKRLDALTEANKHHAASSKEATVAQREQAQSARELAQATSEADRYQASMDERLTETREKLSGLNDQQVEYARGVRDLVAQYKDWIRSGMSVQDAMARLSAGYKTLGEQRDANIQAAQEEINQSPQRVKAYQTETSEAERYYQVISEGAKTAADTIANYFVRNVRSIKDLWKGLVDSAKTIVAQIISTWLQLRVIQPLLGSVFGGGGGGSIWGQIGSYFVQNAVSGGSGSGGGTGSTTGGTAGGNSLTDYYSNLKSAKSTYDYFFGGAGGASSFTGGGSLVAGSTYLGPGSTSLGAYGGGQSTGVLAGGTYTGPGSTAIGWGSGAPYAGYTPYGGMYSIGGYSAPLASYGGAIAGAYYGAHQGDGGFGTVGSTVAYGALGAGIAGTAAGVAGGASVGAAAGSAFGATAAASSWIPIVGWIAALAALVDHFSGGKVFGTKYRTDASDVSLNIGADGSSADASVHQWKYRSQLSQAFGRFGGALLPSDWGDKDKRFKSIAVTPEMTAAAQALYDNIEKTLVKGAQQLGVDAPAMIEASLSAQSTYNKKGKLTGTSYVVEYLGRTWKEATADAAAQRIGAEALVKVVEASAGSVAQTIAEQFRGSVETLLDGAQAMLEAQADINKGNSLVALGASATLAQVIAFTQGLQADGEKLADTYTRLMQASASYLQFVGQFAPQSQTFGGALQAINQQMLANIDQANALAQAAGLQGAREEDLANIHQYAAQQAAAAIAQLDSAAQDLVAKLYGVTQGSLAAITSQLDAMKAKVQASTQTAIGDLSPLNDKEKLDLALKGLRSGITSADDVLSLGRKLYASSSDYAGLYDQVMGIVGGTGAADTGASLDQYNQLAAQQATLQAQASATARFNDAKTLAQYVADLSQVHGVSYTEAASGLGLNLQQLAQDLGLTNLTGYLDTLKAQDLPGTAMTAASSIVEAIRGIGSDIVSAILKAPVVQPGPTTANSTSAPDAQQQALIDKLNQLIEQNNTIIEHTGTTADTNKELLGNSKRDILRGTLNSSRTSAPA